MQPACAFAVAAGLLHRPARREQHNAPVHAAHHRAGLQRCGLWWVFPLIVCHEYCRELLIERLHLLDVACMRLICSGTAHHDGICAAADSITLPSPQPTPEALFTSGFASRCAIQLNPSTNILAGTPLSCMELGLWCCCCRGVMVACVHSKLLRHQPHAQVGSPCQCSTKK